MSSQYVLQMQILEEVHDFMAENKYALSVEESAAYTGRNTLRQLVAWGKIPFLRVGRKILIRRDILERFIVENEGKNLRNEKEVKSVTV